MHFQLVFRYSVETLVFCLKVFYGNPLQIRGLHDFEEFLDVSDECQTILGSAQRFKVSREEVSATVRRVQECIDWFSNDGGKD